MHSLPSPNSHLYNTVEHKKFSHFFVPFFMQINNIFLHAKNTFTEKKERD